MEKQEEEKEGEEEEDDNDGEESDESNLEDKIPKEVITSQEEFSADNEQVKFIKSKNNTYNINANIVNITYKTSNDKYFICMKANKPTDFSESDIHSYIYHQDSNCAHYIHSQ